MAAVPFSSMEDVLAWCQAAAGEQPVLGCGGAPTGRGAGESVVVSGGEPGVSPLAAAAASAAAPVYEQLSVPDTLLLYKAEITGPLERVRAMRGKVVETHGVMSICSGAAPESKFEEITQVPTECRATCDPKASSWRWVEANGPPVHHHFRCLHDMVSGIRLADVDSVSISAQCAKHQQVCEYIVPKRK